MNWGKGDSFAGRSRTPALAWLQGRAPAKLIRTRVPASRLWLPLFWRGVCACLKPQAASPKALQTPQGLLRGHLGGDQGFQGMLLRNPRTEQGLLCVQGSRSHPTATTAGLVPPVCCGTLGERLLGLKNLPNHYPSGKSGSSGDWGSFPCSAPIAV